MCLKIFLQLFIFILIKYFKHEKKIDNLNTEKTLLNQKNFHINGVLNV